MPSQCLTLCDPTDCSTPGFLVLHHLPEFAQTHVHWVSDAIQPSPPLIKWISESFQTRCLPDPNNNNSCSVVAWCGERQCQGLLLSFTSSHSSACAGPLRPFLHFSECFFICVWQTLLKNCSLVLAGTRRQTRNHIGSRVCYYLPCTISCATACNKTLQGFRVGISVFMLHCLLGKTHHSHVLRFMSC